MPSTATVTPSVRVIVFSKDRAFQLGQYLRTLYAWSSGATLDVHVLYRVDSPACSAPEARDFAASYARVQAAFPGVHFVREIDFAAQLKDIVAGAQSHVLFGVDDALFCGEVPLGAAVAALEARPTLLCVHLRLSPGLSFCHTADAIQSLPRLRTWGTELALFQGGDGSHDWDYPFDLCASLYRKSLVQSIIGDIELTEGPDGIGHPNKLEACGNKALAGRLAAQTLPQTQRACLQRRAVVVVTINRVQSVFSNRIFSGTPTAPPRPTSAVDGAEDQDAGEGQVGALDKLLHGGAELDEHKYLALSHHYSSVHVGGLWLKTAPAGRQRSCPGQAVVSVVMPVRNCERFLRAALLSLQEQTLGEFEAIIVNDACSDSSTEIIAQTCRSDARFSELRLSHNVGVARALALGVRMARTGLIARMDADDICHPDRLRRQVLFLQTHPQAAVVGSAVSVIDSHYQYPPQLPGGFGEGQGGAEAGKGDGYKIIEQPTLAGHVRWRLLFHCCVAHPSVMMRRDSLLRCGGYLRPDERTHIGHITVEHVEDYHLWMRVVGLLPSPAACTSAPAAAATIAPFDLARVARSNTDTPHPHTAGSHDTNANGIGGSDRHAAEGGHEICNLGDVLLLLRKHPQNISGLQADEQASKALTLRQLALARLLPPVSASGIASSALLSTPSVQALGRPEKAESCQALRNAQLLLSDVSAVKDSVTGIGPALPAGGGRRGGVEEGAYAKTCDGESLCMALARCAVDLEIEGRAAELGTEALRRLETGDPLAMTVWRQWLSSHNDESTAQGGGRIVGEKGARRAGPTAAAPHPLMALLKGLGRS